MAIRLSKIDKIDACALPALRDAFDALLRMKMDATDILAGLNAELSILGLPTISRSGFHRWASKVRAGKIKCPEPELHSRMDVEGTGGQIDTVTVPPFMLLDQDAIALQLRIIAIDQATISTVLALSFTREEFSRGMVRFEPIALDLNKNYAVHMSTIAEAASCLSSLFKGGFPTHQGSA